MGVRVPPGLQNYAVEKIIMINKIRNYLINVRLELAKVSWPTFPELISSTNVVIIVTTFFAIFLLIVDRILANLMQYIIG